MVCLEQVADIMKVDQSAVKEMIEKLETVYVVHTAILNVWCYGDVSNRERLMIVAIHKKFRAMSDEYCIPAGDFDSSRAPQAWMVVCDDRNVAQNLWRNDKILKTQIGASQS